MHFFRPETHPRGDGQHNISLLEPLDYFTLVQLMKRAAVVLTDSGGIQEEAPSLGKPVLVMREMSERMEGVEAGNAMLLGTSEKRIIEAVSLLLDDTTVYKKMSRAGNPYGDGTASKKIFDVIKHHFKPDSRLKIYRQQFRAEKETLK